MSDYFDTLYTKELRHFWLRMNRPIKTDVKECPHTNLPRYSSPSSDSIFTSSSMVESETNLRKWYKNLQK